LAFAEPPGIGFEGQNCLFDVMRKITPTLAR